MTLLSLTTGFLLWMCCATHKASAGAACEDPPLIEFGKIVSGIKSEYEENDRVQYTCDPGYALSGSEWVTCHGKVWMPGPPQCLERPCGSIPAVANAAFEGRSKEKYEPGETVRYQCHEGFQVTGPPEIFCRRGTWSTPPICEDVRCGPPPEIPNARIISTQQQRYLPGAKVHYECESNSQIMGVNYVICSDGHWTKEPSCRVIGLPGEGGKCGPPPDIENGDILSFQLKQYPQGAMLKYKCASFYILKGPEQITCTDGQWTNPPVCLAACTASEEDMDRNNIELRWRGERKLYSTSGDFIEFDCKIGYVQDPASSPFRVQCMDGTLEYPRCKPGREGGKCGPPPDIENGDILSFQLKQYPEGATLKYKCASFYILKGPEQITCIDGQWTNPPVCLAACTTSEEDMDRNNIELKWSGERKTYLKSGDFVEFDCKIGYVQDPASSPFRVQCMDGTLEYPRCKPGKILCSPPRVPNGNFRPQEDSYREGATITIDCNPGYHLRTLPGKNTAQCTSRGWVPAPDCVEKPCDYPVIENGKISERMAHSYFPMRIGQYVDYHCRNGYLAPNGGRVVRIYCSKGGWNPEPKCLKTCFVTHLENGYFRYNRYTYTEGERIQYVCNQDYRTESAGGEVTCTKNGWSPFPRCIRKNVTCEPPPEIAGGKVQGVKKPRYLPGETAHYQCWQGFQMTGASTVTCQNGTWTERPQCKEKPCDYPVIENGKISERMAHSYFPMRIGQYVDYHCRNGYLAPNGGRVVRIYCSKGGWNPEPKCLKTCFVTHLENGYFRYNRYTYTEGERIQYVCNQDYRTESAGGEVTCTKNGWSPFPRCIRKMVCTASEEDMDRNNIELIWRGERKLYSTSGGFTEFDCKIGYVQDPASSPFRVQCMDGTLEYPRCKPGRNCRLSETAMARNNIKLRWSSKRSNIYRSKETISFKCYFLFREVSNPEDFEAQCQDGVINYPRCQSPMEKCDSPPPIANGALKLPPLAQYESGSSVQYSCYDYHFLQGSERIYCSAGQWTSPPNVYCVARKLGEEFARATLGKELVVAINQDINSNVQPNNRNLCTASAGAACEDPPLIEFGKIVSGVKSEYEENDRVQYTCDPGYALSGSEWVTCHGKVWMPGPPQCLERPCGSIPAVANAAFEGRSKEKYEPGETVRYQCHEGFQVTGPPEIFCRRGNWSTPPICEDVSCGPPPEIPNAHVTSTQQQRYLPGAKVHYECESNSQIMGVNYVICSDGHWTKEPHCRGEGGKCGPPPDIENGDILSFQLKQYPEGATLKYKCASFYILKGPEQITCIDGQWTNPPVCLAACTTSEEDMDRNNIELKWSGERKLYLKSGDFVEFDCKIGYVQDPASSPFRVQCMDGTLEYPRCKPGKDCTVLETAMESNNIKLRQPRRRSYTYRSEEYILFTCKDSYHEVSNPEDFNAQCQDGVINYPRCENVTCEPPPEIAGGKVQGVKKPRYLPGETAHYQCWQGFQMTGASTVTCQNGTWTEQPQCKAFCTTSKEDMNRNNIELKWVVQRNLSIKSGNFIEFDCKIGYVQDPASSPFRVQCMDGTLEYPRCKPGRNCILSETAMERNNIKLRWSRKRSNIYRSKETILFKCNSPYREVSNPEDFEAQCQDGVINYPRCGSYFG
ncbi:complement factor H [Anas platyrhynchos]|uniref:complement factor H n=1 Tax=Anas platyrhynchos TaxID=8839 RepID=UPI003AF2229B